MTVNIGAAAVLFFAFAILTSVTGTAEERLRAVVAPLETSGDDVRIEPIAETVTDVIHLIIALLDNYGYVDVPMESTECSMDPAELSDAFDAENVIFGDVASDGRTIAFSLGVFNRIEGRVTVEQRDRTDTVFDVFDIADALTAAAIEGLAGERLRLGAIRIAFPDLPGPFAVFVDDLYAGLATRVRSMPE